MKRVELTQQEIWAHTKPKVHQNKKKWSRKKRRDDKLERGKREMD